MDDVDVHWVNSGPPAAPPSKAQNKRQRRPGVSRRNVRAKHAAAAAAPSAADGSEPAPRLGGSPAHASRPAASARAPPHHNDGAEGALPRADGSGELIAEGMHRQAAAVEQDTPRVGDNPAPPIGPDEARRHKREAVRGPRTGSAKPRANARARPAEAAPDGTTGDGAHAAHAAKPDRGGDPTRAPALPALPAADAAVEPGVFARARSFGALPIDARLAAHVEGHMHLAKPTHVQAEAVPAVLAGGDVLIRAETGSGKTLAYLLPIVHMLIERSRVEKVSREDGTLALLLAPTRELAVQTLDVLSALCRPLPWVVCGAVVGGEKRKSEKARLRKGVTALVATPGRLDDHLTHTASLKVSRTRVIVLDEADRCARVRRRGAAPSRRAAAAPRSTAPSHTRALAPSARVPRVATRARLAAQAARPRLRREAAGHPQPAGRRA